MGTDIVIFANHAIDFSNNNLEYIANDIKYKLDNSIIANRGEIQSQIRSYYDWQGHDDLVRSKWHREIDNWTGNNWEYFAGFDFSSCTEICYSGPFKLRISFTDKHIQFHDPGCRYNSFFDMEKEYRDVWRKYYYQYISLFGGNIAIYLPDQGEVAEEFTEKVWDYNPSLEMIVKGLLNKYGQNVIGINDFPHDENGFIDPPHYFIDTFDDLK